jgi:hypothetical protein
LVCAAAWCAFEAVRLNSACCAYWSSVSFAPGEGGVQLLGACSFLVWMFCACSQHACTGLCSAAWCGVEVMRLKS